MNYNALRQLHKQNLSLKQIGEALGVSKFTVSRHLKKLGLDPNYPNMAGKWFEGFESVLEQLIEDGEPIPSIAEKFEVSARHVRAFAHSRCVCERLPNLPIVMMDDVRANGVKCASVIKRMNKKNLVVMTVEEYENLVGSD